mgnify:CR=1 FL=1
MKEDVNSIALLAWRFVFLEMLFFVNTIDNAYTF